MVLQKRLYRNNNSLLQSIVYHDIFDYPLTAIEAKRWYLASKQKIKVLPIISFEQEYYFLEGRVAIIKARKAKEKESQRKLEIAQSAANILKNIPTILFVGITGSLAMKNAGKGSDIDFLIITKSGSLWTTRIIVYLVLRFLRISIRKAGESEEENKLCLNMWMDEKDLFFSQHNIFTAHEVAQIVPLVNKNQTFERLIHTNKWIFDYWPRAVVQKRVGKRKISKTIFNIFEPIAYQLQLWYMKNKRSREVVTATRAFFHPFDWGAKVIEELKKRGVPSSTAKNK